MLVIYIALVFILLGVAFFALSTKTERRTIPAGEPLSSASRRNAPVVSETKQEAPVKQESSVPSGHIGVQEHVFYREGDSEQSVSPDSGHDFSAASPGEPPRSQSAVYSPVQELKETMNEASAPAETGEASIDAVLFEDRDSVVSFGEGPDSVSPELFSNLSRLCDGNLTLGPDSLTLRSADTLYRFDFHRLKEIRGDASSVLIFPDNMNHPLLILSPGNSDFAGQVLDLYISFRKERQNNS